MEEMIKLELQGVLVRGARIHHLVVRFLKHSQIGSTVEEIVLLHQNGIVVLFLSEVPDGLQVFLLKVLLLHLL